MAKRPMQLPSVDLSDAPCTFSTEPLDRVMDLGYRNLEFVVEDGVEILPGKLIDRCSRSAVATVVSNIRAILSGRCDENKTSGNPGFLSSHRIAEAEGDCRPSPAGYSSRKMSRWSSESST